MPWSYRVRIWRVEGSQGTCVLNQWIVHRAHTMHQEGTCSLGPSPGLKQWKHSIRSEEQEEKYTRKLKKKKDVYLILFHCEFIISLGRQITHIKKTHDSVLS